VRNSIYPGRANARSTWTLSQRKGSGQSVCAHGVRKGHRGDRPRAERGKGTENTPAKLKEGANFPSLCHGGFTTNHTTYLKVGGGRGPISSHSRENAAYSCSCSGVPFETTRWSKKKGVFIVTRFTTMCDRTQTAPTHLHCRTDNGMSGKGGGGKSSFFLGVELKRG